MTSSDLPSVGIVGLGQIGGSIALDLVGRSGVNFYARSRTAQEAGTSAGFSVCRTLEELSSRSELIFVAVPVDQSFGVIDSLMGHLVPGQIVTDVGSTKHSLMQWAAKAQWPDGVEFIGGHPMAGSDISGFSGARKGLFEDRTWILTPGAGVSDGTADALVRLVQLITSGLHARVGIMDSSTHDQAVAKASHLEHLVALALVSLVRGSGEQSIISRMVAGSFKDATRVCKSSVSMVVPFLIENDYLPNVANQFKAEIDGAAKLLQNQAALTDMWEVNSRWRQEIETASVETSSVSIPRGQDSIDQLKRLTLEGRLVCSVDPSENGLIAQIC